MKRAGVNSLAVCAGVLGTCALLLWGCSPNKAFETKAPQSALPYSKALELAAAAAATVKGQVGTITPTHSMEPYVNENSVIVLEPYTGQPLHKGDIVSFKRSDTDNVLHRILDLNERAVYISGDNNKYSDGWYPLTSIHSRLVIVFYTSGQ